MVKQWRKCGGEEEGNDQQCGGELSVERRVVVGICRLPKSEKAGARYSRRILYNMRLVYFKYTRRILQYAPPVLGHLPPPGPPNLFEVHSIHMRLK